MPRALPSVQTRPGERVVVVGNQDALGKWDPAKGLKLKWGDGHVWKGTIQAPVGKDVCFKVGSVCACVCACARVRAYHLCVARRAGSIIILCCGRLGKACMQVPLHAAAARICQIHANPVPTLPLFCRLFRPRRAAGMLYGRGVMTAASR